MPPALTRRLDRLPLRVRLVAVVLVLLFVALTLTGTAMVLLTRKSLTDAIDHDLALAAGPVAQQQFSQFTNRSGVPTSYALRVMLDNGRVLKPSPESVGEALMHPDIPWLSLTDERVVSHEPFNVGSSDGSGRWRVVAGAADDGGYTYAVAAPLFNADQSVRDLRAWVIGIGALVLLAGGVAGWYAVRRAFRPLAEIEDTAATIAAGDLSRRVPEPPSQDEVSSLSRSLNGMLAQIEQSFAVREASEERMRQFVADASHELRTPLAAVRGYAELYRQGAVTEPEDVKAAFRRIEDEATRMGGMVTDLLLLARLDRQRPLQLAPVDLTVLAADAVQDAKALDPAREVRLVPIRGALQPVVVDGDEAQLRQLLTNLIGNAVNHTPAGTPVELAVGPGEQAGRVQLQVRDHGPGIDPAEAGKVFERFYRADPSRRRGTGGGTGLGLAIVAAIVASHRGRVGLAQTPGGGATFVVDLPATARTANSQPVPSTV
ncbi:MAG TPA: HAMP domain-containing sensor histidine kinase [Dermatophilaceae bacterium]|nr:HAMP domain-containing sensor histidine kinase [Dermatophilaceae bacterium]